MYFERVRHANYVRWDRGRPGLVCTNTGISALVKIAGEIIRHLELRQHLDAKNMDVDELMLYVEPFIEPICEFLATTFGEILDEDLRVPFGSAAPRVYFYKLASVIHKEHSDFLPEGFTEWVQAQSQDRIEKADKKIKNIRGIVVAFLFDKLKEAYGEDNNKYWEIGVTDKALRTKAYQVSLDTPIEERASIENYLDILDYKKIIDSKEIWLLVSSVLDMPPPGEKGKSKNTAWIAHFNDARKAGEHSTFARRYSNKDIEFLEWCEQSLYENLQKAAEAGDPIASRYAAGQMIIQPTDST